MFPLLALLFEKCELATQSSECPSTESFNLDIQAFVQHQGREGKPFFTDNHDVNDLVKMQILLSCENSLHQFDGLSSIFLIDGESHSSVEDTPVGVGESSRAVQRLL